jgi:hypothetical protein
MTQPQRHAVIEAAEDSHPQRVADVLVAARLLPEPEPAALAPRPRDGDAALAQHDPADALVDRQRLGRLPPREAAAEAVPTGEEQRHRRAVAAAHDHRRRVAVADILREALGVAGQRHAAGPVEPEIESEVGVVVVDVDGEQPRPSAGAALAEVRAVQVAQLVRRPADVGLERRWDGRGALEGQRVAVRWRRARRARRGLGQRGQRERGAEQTYDRAGGDRVSSHRPSPMRRRALAVTASMAPNRSLA